MTQQSPDGDTTSEDIHANRRRIAEKFGHDLAAIVEDAKKRQATSVKSGDRSLNHRPHPRVPDVMTPGDVCHRRQNRRHYSQSRTRVHGITAFELPA